jgi:hypothetical protein
VGSYQKLGVVKTCATRHHLCVPFGRRDRRGGSSSTRGDCRAALVVGIT